MGNDTNLYIISHWATKAEKLQLKLCRSPNFPNMKLR